MSYLSVGMFSHKNCFVRTKRDRYLDVTEDEKSSNRLRSRLNMTKHDTEKS